MRRPWYVLIMTTVLAIFFAGMTDSAQAARDLLITPTRLVLDDRISNASFTLVNTGSDVKTYRISFTQMRMTEDGRLVPIDPDDQPDIDAPNADSFIIFSPRQFVLPPNTPQILRLAVRKPSGLKPGEYRSHLLIQSVQSNQDVGTSTEQPGQGFSLQINAVFSVSIPVIVRHGNPTAQVALSDIQLRQPVENEEPSLALRINRRGNRSLYGDITVTFHSSTGDEFEVGVLRGIAVYLPLSARQVNIALPTLPVNQSSGRLKITFKERPEYGGSLVAEEWLDL